MKSYPSCWNKTLAQLGFRRKLRRNRGGNIHGRRPLFENLEAREMLTVAGPVNTLLDVVDANDTLYSLREAITAANTNMDADTIHFATGLTGTITLTATAGQLPAIAHPLTIDGPGAKVLAISGGDFNRVLQINSSANNVTIEGLTIKDGYHASVGGGIYNNGGNLNLQNLSLIDNQSNDKGGGLYSLNGNVTIQSSTFENNRANKGGGARIDVSASSVVDISSTTFANNRADVTATGYSGGLFLSGSNTTTPAQITNSTFSGNLATDYSGGLRVDSSRVEIKNSTITLNNAELTDGGITILGSGAAVTLHNSIVAGNISQTNASKNEVGGTLNAASSYNLFGAGGSYNGTNNSVLSTGQTASLAPLGDYGGPTKTHALMPESPALNSGGGSALTVDQRGFLRPVGTVDRGAAESPELFHGDFDGDHRDDQLQFDAGTGTLIVVTNPSGASLVKKWGQVDDSIAWLNPQIVDFNGDSRDDILLQNNTGSVWKVGISDGNAFFFTDVTLNGDWVTSYVGDFDGDGAEDLLGQPTTGLWQVMRYSEAGGAQLTTLTGTPPIASVGYRVGDVNRDGQDDLFYRVSSTQWNVTLAAAGGVSFRDEVNWGSWFENTFQANPTKYDPDAAYQKVLDTFADVYNNYELELYPGLMKGLTATEQTKAGNAWDQAALLVDKLEALPELADTQVAIGSGKVRVSVAELAKLLGTREKLSIQISPGFVVERDNALAPFNIIKLAMDGNATPVNDSGVDVRDPLNPENDIINVSRYATAIEFTHVWVRVFVPGADGLTEINLDPSWKFKDRQAGIDLGAIGFNSDNARGLFDEYDYLSNDPTTDKRLPVEFFEDEVMEYLVQHYPGTSLADVPKDGPIIQRSFAAFPASLGTGVVTVETPTEYSNLQFILDSEELRQQLTHQVRLSVNRDTTLIGNSLNVVPNANAPASYTGLDGTGPTSDKSYTPTSVSQFIPYPGWPDGGSSSTTNVSPPNSVSQLTNYGDATISDYQYQVNFSNKTLQPYLPFDNLSNFVNVPSNLQNISNFPVPTGAGTGTSLEGAITITANNHYGGVIKAIPIPSYTITPNTKLELDFTSTDRGSIHGIGMGSSLSPSLLGTSQFYQLWRPFNNETYTEQSDLRPHLPNLANFTMNYTEGTGPIHLTLDVGQSWHAWFPQFSTPTITYLYFFVEAEEGNTSPRNGTANTTFANISFREGDNPYGGPVALSSTQGSSVSFVGTQYKYLTVNADSPIAPNANYPLTPNTILEFDFKPGPGDFHAIGWDADNTSSNTDDNFSHIYQVDGYQNRFELVSPLSSSGGIQHFRIRIGDDATIPPDSYINLRNLVFIHHNEGYDPDYQGTGETQNTEFSNIKLYEEPLGQATIVNDSSGDHAIKLTGLMLKAFDVANYELTENTELVFNFKSTVNGQNSSHFIGWDINGTLNESTANDEFLFNIFGEGATSQNFNIYDGSGSERTITIAIGRLGKTAGTNSAGKTLSQLIFGVDDGGIRSSADSIFSDIRLRENVPFGSFSVNGSGQITQLGTSAKVSTHPSGLASNSTITENSWLTFTYESDSRGLRHTIGLKDGNINSTAMDFHFDVYGSQANSHGLYQLYSGSGNPQNMAIPLGSLAGSTFHRLSFTTTEDGSGPPAESKFSNITLWRPETPAPVRTSASITLSGTSAETLPINYQVTPNTVLKVKFQSGMEGQYHAIGVDTDITYTENPSEAGRIWQLYGRGNRADFIQTTPNYFGGVQEFTIPIGEYFSGNANRIVFYNANDPFAVGANSIFSDIRFEENVGPTGELWNKTLTVPVDSLNSIQFRMEHGGGNKYKSQLFVDDAPKAGSNGYDIWVDSGDSADIVVQHLNPEKFGISAPSQPYIYDQEFDEIVVLGLDANQHSRDSLASMQSELIASLSSNSTEDQYKEDIDDILSYAAANYWYDFNQQNETIAGITNTISSQSHVGSGVAMSAKQFLVDGSGSPTDYLIKHLTYQVAPQDMGVDLPNMNHFPHSPVTGVLNSEAFQLLGYNSSALEHNIVEEVITTESVSTMKGLQLALKNSAAKVLELESRVIANGTREIVHVADWTGTAITPIGQVFTNNEQYLTNTITGKLKAYYPEQDEFADSIYDLLNVPASEGTIRILLPSLPTVMEYWEGAVHVIEKGTLLSFKIQKEGEDPANGAFGIGDPRPKNPILPDIPFTYATYAGDPVNTANGNMFRDDVDIAFPNLGVPLDFARHYDSSSKENIGLGVGWVHSFGDVLIKDTAAGAEADDLIWITASGQRHKLESRGGGQYEVPAALHGSFTYVSSESKYKYKDKSGIEHHFDNKTSVENGTQVRGRLIDVIDNIGNGVKVTYKTATNVRRIATVEDIHTPNRRLEFDYDETVTVNNSVPSNPIVNGNRITKIRKYADAALVGDWDYNFQSITGTSATSSQRLISVMAPSVTVVDATGTTSPVRPTTSYGYYQSGRNKGIIETITEPDSGVHKYEYYPNGRVFRVTDANLSKQTFSYNLFRGSTEFVDENGNTETYFHQENGLLAKQIHDDRTRQEYTWGNVDTPAEFLMTSSTDEVGAVETFKYYVSDATWLDGTMYEQSVTPGDFRDRELFESTAKHFPGDDLLLTRFDYSKPPVTALGHMINLKSTIVDPGDATHQNITTQYKYDYDDVPAGSLGRLWKTIDDFGNVTLRTYYANNGSPQGGLLQYETTANGMEMGYRVPWKNVDTVTINGTTLSVRTTHPGASPAFIADAIRIDRVGTNFTKIIDDDNNASDSSFVTVGGSYIGSSSYEYFEHDRTVIDVGDSAVWTFTGLEPGTYKVSMTWAVVATSVHNTAVPVEVFDGLAGSVSLGTTPIDQDTYPLPADYYGDTTQFLYDAAGKITQAKIENRPPTINAYHHTGGMASITSPSGVANVYTHNVLGWQVESKLVPTAGIPQTSTFSYDAAGRVRFSTNPLERKTEFLYDHKGQLTNQINPDGTDISYEYDGVGNRTSIIDELGRETRFVYDSRNRLIETVYADGNSTRLRYNGAGQIAATIDELGRETKFTYDAAGRQLTTTNAKGDVSTNEYDELGHLKHSLDFKNNKTEFKYDKLGRVIETRSVTPAGTNVLALTTTDYDANGNVLSTAVYDTSVAPINSLAANVPFNPRDLITDQNKIANKVQVTEFKYDTLDRLIEAVNADGTSVRTIYDNDGRLKYQYDELNRKKELQYDVYGRLAKTIAPDPDGPTYPLLSPETEYQYDAAGNQIKSIDPNDNVTNFTYDVRNRLISTTDALGGQTHTIYDLAGQVVATVDALGHVLFTLHDKRGRALLTREADPDGAGPLTAPETRYDYYATGKLNEKIDALGNATEYEYDELNRLITEITHLPQEVRILDDTNPAASTGDPGFSIFRSNGQTTLSTSGWEGDATIIHPATGGNPDALADWKFVGLSPGTYRAYITWNAHADVTTDFFMVRFYNTANAQIQQITTVNGDQTQAPVGVSRIEDGTFSTWLPISNDLVLTGQELQSLTVRVWSLDNKKLVADAVRLERIEVPSVKKTYTYDDNGNLDTVTDTLGRVTDYDYDALNRQTKVTLPDPDKDYTPGSTTNGSLPSPITETQYDGYGNVKKTIEARGGQPRETVFTYDKRNRLNTKNHAPTSSVATTTEYLYDQVGNLTHRIEDIYGVAAKTEYEYDALNRQIVEKRYRDAGDPLPLLTTTTYDAVGNVTSTTDSVYQVIGPHTRVNASTVNFTYDVLNRLSSSKESDGVTWQAIGDPLAITDGTLSVRLSTTTSGKVVVADAIRIDRLGPNGEILDTRIIDDDRTGSDPRFTIGGGAHFESTDDNQTEYGGDIAYFTGATKATWTFTGLTAGNYRVSATWVQDHLNADHFAQYELFKGAAVGVAAQVKLVDQSLAVAGFSGSTTKFAYDAAGNLIAETNPLGHVTMSEYDRLNRLVKTTNPDPDGSSSYWPSATGLPSNTTYAYDAVDQLIAETNGENGTTRYAYDLWGNLIRETDGENHATRKTYDSEGNLLTYTDPEGYVTTYTYDNLDRIKTDTITLSGLPVQRTYSYNPQGNLVQTIDREERRTNYLYDARDRLKTEIWYVGTSQVGLLEWEHDGLGRVWFSRDATNGGNSIVHTDYDDLGRVLKERNYCTGFTTTAPQVEQRYTYDMLDAVDWRHFVHNEYSQWSMPSGGTEMLIGTTVTLTDKLGRIARIEDTPAGEATKRIEFTYDVASQLIDVARSAGTFFFDTRYEYDQTGRVTEIGHYRDDDTLSFSRYLYQYDRADRITNLHTVLDTAIPALPAGPSGSSTRWQRLYYDEAGQLVGNSSSWRGLDETFAYDDNGNRVESTTEGVSNGTTVVGDHNRLAEDADWIYQYDKEGNLTKKTAKTNFAIDPYTQYVYDHRNRLVSTTEFGPTGAPYRGYYYQYDAENRLVKRTFQELGMGPFLDPGDEHYSIYSDGQRTLTFDGVTDELTHRTTWAPGADQLLSDDVFDAQGQLEETLWAATNHLGSIQQLLDGSEAIVEHRDYNSFGELEAAFDELGNSIIATEFLSEVGYTGKFFDSATGLQYNNARWYDPSTGRFLSEDPTGFADGPNPYRYAGNDPVNFSDPTGLSQAGNPLNNLYGRSSKSGGLSTSSLINSFNGPSRTPSVKDFSNVGLTAPSYDPLGMPSYLTHSSAKLGRELLPTGPSLLDRVGSAFNTVTTFTQDFGRTYIDYVGTGFSTAGSTMLNSARETLTSTKNLATGLYYDPIGTVSGIGTSVYDTGVGVKNAAVYAWNNPGQTVSDIGSGIFNYGDALTNDPRVSGRLLGNLGTSAVTGGVAAAGKQLVGTVVNAFRKLDNAVPDNLLKQRVLDNIAESRAARDYSNFTTHRAIESIYDNARTAVEIAKNAGLTNQFGRLGSRAHQVFSELNAATNRALAGTGVRVAVEEFRDVLGNFAVRNSAGSKGLDVFIEVAGQAYRGFDLKTGREWSQRTLQDIQGRFGIPVTQIKK